MFRLRMIRLIATVIVVAVAYHTELKVASAQERLMRIEIVANDMCCQGCAQNVAAQLYAAPGVTNVEADVPNRIVVVTAKPSPKLTPQKLWTAVEQGKGGPSKMTTAFATYTLTRPDGLKPENRLPDGQYTLVLREFKTQESAQQIANQLYRIRGVTKVSADGKQPALFVQSPGVMLSPWALLAAAELAQAEPTAVNGPHGLLTIERAKETNRATADRPTYSQTQGGVR